MSQKSQNRISDGKLVLFALVGGLVAFSFIVMLVSSGAIRLVRIFLPEKTYATVAFQNIGGQVELGQKAAEETAYE